MCLLARFTQVMREQEAARAERERQRALMARADPFDSEAQRLIAVIHKFMMM